MDKVLDCELSFAEFFETEVKGRIQSVALPLLLLEFVSARAGKSKDLLDKVDLMLQVQSVVSLFGPYIIYCTQWRSWVVGDDRAYPLHHCYYK